MEGGGQITVLDPVRINGIGRWSVKVQKWRLKAESPMLCLVLWCDCAQWDGE
jgi:hypothetical protein